MSSSIEHIVRSAALVDKLTTTHATFKAYLGEAEYAKQVALHRVGIMKFVELTGLTAGAAAIRLAQEFAKKPGELGELGALGILAAYVEMMEEGAIAATNALLEGKNYLAAEALADAAIRRAGDVE